MRVRVYRNLHKKCYSIVSLEGENKGRVIAHEQTVLLEDATFKVSQRGRERVLREKRKNVHAYVKGTLLTPDFPVEDCIGGWEKVTYNPHKMTQFQLERSQRTVYEADMALLTPKGVFI
jgi:hypothetical protein